MRAARVHQFGPPAVILVEDIAQPHPGEHEVLVRVAAAGVGPWDGWIRGGKSVLEQPLPLTLGSDLSGTVVEVGGAVRDLAPGQEVFGVTNPRFTGAYAEYAVASAAMIAPKPSALPHRLAAAVPVVATTAAQALAAGGALAQRRVVVHGAGGSVGALAAQLARLRGAHVIGTSTTRDLEYVRALGLPAVLDATAPRFEEGLEPVDVVIDCVGGESQVRLLSVLRPGGTLISIVSKPDEAEAARRGVQASFLLVQVTTADLVAMAALLETGQLSARLGPVLPLADARHAHEMLEGMVSRPQGKIVLAVD